MGSGAGAGARRFRTVKATVPRRRRSPPSARRPAGRGGAGWRWPAGRRYGGLRRAGRPGVVPGRPGRRRGPGGQRGAAGVVADRVPAVSVSALPTRSARWSTARPSCRLGWPPWSGCGAGGAAHRTGGTHGARPRVVAGDRGRPRSPSPRCGSGTATQDRPLGAPRPHLRAAAGGMTAIVGPSGAGKSTIFALLERYYEPQSGTIAVDGRDIRGWPLPELRAAIGYVEQDAPVLAGTLRENLCLAAPDATDGDLRAVLTLTRLERPARTAPGRAGHADRPPRHDPVRRGAAADRHRPGPAAPPPGPPARRGHLAARRGQRVALRGADRGGGAHHHRGGGRPPAVHRHQRRPDPGHGGAAGCAPSAPTTSWSRPTTSTASSPPPSS